LVKTLNLRGIVGVGSRVVRIGRSRSFNGSIVVVGSSVVVVVGFGLRVGFHFVEGASVEASVVNSVLVGRRVKNFLLVFATSVDLDSVEAEVVGRLVNIFFVVDASVEDSVVASVLLGFGRRVKNFLFVEGASVGASVVDSVLVGLRVNFLLVVVASVEVSVDAASVLAGFGLRVNCFFDVEVLGSSLEAEVVVVGFRVNCFFFVEAIVSSAEAVVVFVFLNDFLVKSVVKSSVMVSTLDEVVGFRSFDFVTSFEDSVEAVVGRLVKNCFFIGTNGASVVFSALVLCRVIGTNGASVVVVASALAVGRRVKNFFNFVIVCETSEDFGVVVSLTSGFFAGFSAFSGGTENLAINVVFGTGVVWARLPREGVGFVIGKIFGVPHVLYSSPRWVVGRGVDQVFSPFRVTIGTLV
jgi:hypothetical protein